MGVRAGTHWGDDSSRVMSHQSANPLWLCRVGGHGRDRGHHCHVDLSCGRRSYRHSLSTIGERILPWFNISPGPFPNGTIFGEEPAGSLLCGFAFAFDRHAKSFASSFNAYSSS